MNVKYMTIGILAHVDAGKTTLSEALLYAAGAIRKAGRVDHGDAFLDTDSQERRRGITIFSKQALFRYGDTEFTLLDTPGHVDFSAETERTLQVLDAAILVISAPEGVQSHTKTLWDLLRRFRIPVFVFVNKMDQPGVRKERVLEELQNQLKGGFLEFASSRSSGRPALTGTAGNAGTGRGTSVLTDITSAGFQEELAALDEELLERYLLAEEAADGVPGVDRAAGGAVIGDADITRLILERKLFPCCFGSALRQEGVEGLLTILDRFCPVPAEYPQAFGARVFKITRDEQGKRLTWMKITGGSLKAKMRLPEPGAGAGAETKNVAETKIGAGAESGGGVEDRQGQEGSVTAEESAAAGEKADQLRRYSGTKYTPLSEAEAGMVIAVTGPEKLRAGQGLGFEVAAPLPLLSPVLNYRVRLPEGADAAAMLPKFRALEEEEPELHIVWDDHSKEIHVQLMGEVQKEVLQTLCEQRFGVRIGYDDGSIAYRETIADTVEGVGHFEPLRHYAEVHLLMEPGERGSGLVFETAVSVDHLAQNWQRLILTHLKEKAHLGVLTGSPITDMKITVAAGRAHLKHTEGGDFRQATYRAVRNGLMKAESVLLEPWYEFTLSVPQENVGRAMTDLGQMGADFSLRQASDDAEGSGNSTIQGALPGMPGSVPGSPGLPDPKDGADADTAVLTGRVPVSEIRNYDAALRAYTRGAGCLSVRFSGYFPCHNADQVIAASGYDPELDPRNSPDSVFCSHGVGTIIPWYAVEEYMHLPSVLGASEKDAGNADRNGTDPALTLASGSGRRAGHRIRTEEEPLLSIDEIDEILNRTYFANRRSSGSGAKRRPYGQRRRYQETPDGIIRQESGRSREAAQTEKSVAALRVDSGLSDADGTGGRNHSTARGAGAASDKAADATERDGKGRNAPENAVRGNRRKEYLLVDGYNMIFAWPELKELAEENIDSARLALQDMLSDYQGYRGCELIAVFDAYRVAGHQTEHLDYYNIHIVFTKEAQTADAYIEQFSLEHAKTDRVVVATSDGMEQIIVRSAGSELMSAQDLREDLARRTAAARDTHLKSATPRDSRMKELLKSVRP